MGKKTMTYLKSANPLNDFHSQHLLSKAENDVCTFSDADIKVLISNEKFPSSAFFRAFDSSLKSDFISPTWICFYEYPFSIGLSFPFSLLISDFFRVTGFSFAQVMPMVWRVLSWVDHVNNQTNIGLGLPEIASVYNLRTFGSSRFLFKIKSGKSHLIQKVAHHDIGRKGRFFFVRRTTLPDGDGLPEKWITKIPKFEVLCPAIVDSNRKIKEFLTLPLEVRTFKTVIELPSEEHSTSAVNISPGIPKMSTVSKATRSGSFFAFSDVEALISSKKSEKLEAFLPPPCPKKITGKTATPDSKKRKLMTDIDENVFEGLSFDEIKKKSIIMIQLATAEMSKINEEMGKELAALKKNVEIKMKEIEKLLKKEKEFEAKEEDLLKEIDAITSETKVFVAKSVLQARLMMFEDVKSGDCSLWDEENWRSSLMNLGGEMENVGETSTKYSERKKEGKTSKKIVDEGRDDNEKMKVDGEEKA